MLLLLLACHPLSEDGCNPGDEAPWSDDEPTPVGISGEDALAWAQRATTASLTWSTGETTTLARTVEQTGEAWTCHTDPPAQDRSTPYVVRAWHLPVRWTLATEDGRLDVTIETSLVASEMDTGPWLGADVTEGIDVGDVDPAAWRDFRVTLTEAFTETGATGTATALGWQDAAGSDTYLEEPLATW